MLKNVLAIQFLRETAGISRISVYTAPLFYIYKKMYRIYPKTAVVNLSTGPVSSLYFLPPMIKTCFTRMAVMRDVPCSFASKWRKQSS